MPLLFLVTLIPYGCSDSKSVPVKDVVYREPVKMDPNDPFKSTMVKSQLIEIDAGIDNTVEGENGTVLVIPKGSLVYKDGSEVTGKITIELAEALAPSAMILANLTTTSDGKPLESGGMLYLNATVGGEQLGVNKNNPLYVYVPASEKKPGMQIYTGIRDRDGNMNWTDPKPLREYLLTVPLSELDFLPDGYSKAVADGMPFRKHQMATKALVDSLYFNWGLFYAPVAAELYSFPLTDFQHITEPMYEPIIKSDTSKTFSEASVQKSSGCNQDAKTDATPCCRLKPEEVHVLLNEKFAQTFVATKAFEKRIKVLHQVCGQQLLRVYVDNLEKDLWQCDSMVADRLEGEPQKENMFRRFASEKLTNVKDIDKTATLIKAYFEKKLAEDKEKETELKRRLVKEANARNEKLRKTEQEYRQLLDKRETHRMEGYGFTRTELGWINVDTGIAPKAWFQRPLYCHITNGNDFDRVYCYLYIKDKNSLHKLYSDSKSEHHTGGTQSDLIPLPKYDPVFVAAIGYIGDKVYAAYMDWHAYANEDITLTLSPSDLSQLKLAFDFHGAGGGDKNNNVFVDLAYQDTFYSAEQRKKTLLDEYMFLMKLYNISASCCLDCKNENLTSEGPDGKYIFMAKCSACHLATEERLTGPGLKCVGKRMPKGDWRYKFINNSNALIASGDLYANKIFKENNGAVMPAQSLSREEIDAVIDWLDCGCPDLPLTSDTASPK